MLLSLRVLTLIFTGMKYISSFSEQCHFGDIPLNLDLQVMKGRTSPSLNFVTYDLSFPEHCNVDVKCQSINKVHVYMDSIIGDI